MKMEWISESHNMVDIIHGVIPYNGLESRIIENSIFSRLHRIFQSSLAYLTFPSNKVHRFEHSMGVMHLSGEFFYHSICNSSDENISKLMEEVENELLKWLEAPQQPMGINAQMLADIKKKGKKIFSDREFGTELNCDLFRRYTPSNLLLERRLSYYIVLETVRLVGLLHDVGHMPYSHITEFALQRLYDTVSDPNGKQKNLLDDENAKAFLNIISGYCDGLKNHEIHEAIGAELVDRIFISITETFPHNANHQRECFFVAAVFHLAKRVLNSCTGDNDVFADLHCIVDGVIDCDRMDYCCRDLFCSGVSKEFPRYERIFYTVQLLYKCPPSNDNTLKCRRERCYFAFTTKAIGQIEQLLLRRWEDFSAINYHHKVHKHELLLELEIAELGYESLCRENKTDDRDCNGILPFDISSLWKTIEEIQSCGAVDISVSQLDDEWINTLLRYQYFQKYGNTYNARSKNRNERQWNRLDELITGQRHYRSLFKRSGGFKRFDEAFKNAYGVDDDTSGSLDAIDSFGFNIKLQELNKKGCSSKKYYKYVNTKLDEWSQRQDIQRSLHIIDCVIGGNTFSSGVKAKDMESIYIISSLKNNSSAPLNESSHICQQLEDQKTLFPSFHVYYLPQYDMEHEEYYTVDYNSIQTEIAKIAASCMKELMREYPLQPLSETN